MKDKPVIILAGGFGTRLKSYLGGKPKPMADINGRPFLEYILKNLIQNGFSNFIFSLHYRADIIIEYLNEIENNILNNCSIKYYIEDSPLGTGGAVSYIISKGVIKDEFYVINADTWIKDGLIEFNSIVPNVIALIQVENSDRYGKVELNFENIITKFVEKEEGLGKGLINAGFYKFHKEIFENLNTRQYSLETDFFPALIRQNKLKGHILKTEFIDIGVPSDYLHFCNLIKNK